VRCGALRSQALTVDFQVPLPAPLDVAGSLELFRRSGDDLVDRWDGIRLIRAVPVGAGWVPFVARPSASVRTPGFTVAVSDGCHLEEVKTAVASTFFDAPPDDYARLLHQDPVLAALDARFPGIRQIRQLDLFTALVRCVSAQQVNLRWAVTTRRRLAEVFGTRQAVCGQVVYALDPRRIAAVDPAEIRALQFTTSKAVSLVATARAVVNEDFSVQHLAVLSDDEVISKLVRIKGIGRWSAEWVLARTLGRPRVVAGDLGVRKAVGLAYLSTPLPAEAEVRATTAHWGPSAGTAQALVLHALGEGALSPPGQTVSRAASRP
jgi:DNA-3-methyladenine glycosylase II